MDGAFGPEPGVRQRRFLVRVGTSQVKTLGPTYSPSAWTSRRCIPVGAGWLLGSTVRVFAGEGSEEYAAAASRLGCVTGVVVPEPCFAPARQALAMRACRTEDVASEG